MQASSEPDPSLGALPRPANQSPQNQEITAGT
jgi:hypothetical protein